jgi:hypothetical protein
MKIVRNIGQSPEEHVTYLGQSPEEHQIEQEREKKDNN